METLSLTAADFAVAAIILVSGLLALARGFVKELLSVGAWVGAAVATLYGFKFVVPHARDLISIGWAADAAAAAAIFLVTLIVLTAITHWIASHVRNSNFSAIDRSLGLVFGLLRGAVIVCLVWLLVDWAIERPNQPQWIAEARSLPYVEAGADLIRAVVPEDFRTEGAAAASEAGDAAREAVREEINRRVDESLGGSGGAPAGSDAGSGYDSGMREEMDRLNQQNQ